LARRKRRDPRRLEGRRILDLVPRYLLDSGEDKAVTAARRYIAACNIKPPAMLVVQRGDRTQERFFWGLKGLFSAQYVEEHHFMFPSLDLLRAHYQQGEDGSVA